MNEDRYILFDQYLNNELNLEEKTNFENQLSNDSGMAEAFEIFKDLNSHLSQKFENQENLNSFSNNIKNAATANKNQNKTKIISIKPIYYAVAACFALIFGIMIFNNSNNEPTFENYYKQENANFAERGGDIIKTLKQAQDAFNNDDYKLAASLFETILEKYPRPEIEFFYGVSLMQLDKHYQAEMVFSKLIKGNSAYKNNASWNLGLLKLKQKDFDSCKQILKTIPKDFENYDQVEKLLDSLNK